VGVRNALGWVVVALTGCGFSHGTAPAGDARDGGPLDGAIDADIDGPASSTCYAKWLDGSIRFDTAVPLVTVNSPAYERDPFLSDDELTLYFSSARPTTAGPLDIWVVLRSSTADPFGVPQRATELDSDDSESKLSITADGLVAFVGSDRPGSTNASLDVWQSVRNTITEPWPAMSRSHVMMVETSGSEHDPTISADGKHLYLAPDTPGPQHLAMSTRGPNGDFGPPMALTELNTSTGESDPSPTPDERIIVFSSNRATPGAAGGNLYYATRPSSTGPFSTPRPVPDVNTDAAEGDPHLSSDGCRLYFGRYTGISSAPNQGDWDLFVATAL
jgi:Tol biopolymer transport system component